MSDDPMSGGVAARYLPPGRGARVANSLITFLVRRGIALRGARILCVRGRSSGVWREVPVNLHEFGGGQYLVAPRGQTQWVRNLRAAGAGELRLGRRVQPFRAVELGDDEKPPVLRTYLDRWSTEVRAQFPDVRPDSPQEAFRAVAADYPVFRLLPA